jgi:hypothetical protein
VAEIILQPFDRILSGYEQQLALAVSISDCSYLSKKYASFGVEGYRLDSYQGTSFFNRYLGYSVMQAPMLIYKKKYLIPLVFRQSAESQRLFSEVTRMASFFYLLEWLLAFEPQKAIIDYRVNKYNDEVVIDTPYLAFRLSEIIDGGGFPISRMKTLAEFTDWNRTHQLIASKQIGRHSKLFDDSETKQQKELAMVLKIIQLKYPETTFFL